MLDKYSAWICWIFCVRWLAANAGYAFSLAKVAILDGWIAMMAMTARYLCWLCLMGSCVCWLAMLAR
jgi:hypothetical protein